jgi:phospholipase C
VVSGVAPTPETESGDAELIRSLIRLGWTVAELRGQLRVGDDDPAVPATVYRRRKAHALPLASERTSRERLVELNRVVVSLAKDLGLDAPTPGTALRDGYGNESSRPDISAAERVVELADAVPSRRDDPNWKPTWGAFTEAVYKWDGAIQDQLASEPFGKASAYQLGRGLAEITWALDPSAPVNDIDGWEFLLGTDRILAVTQLLERLDRYFAPLLTKSIMASLGRWQEVAANNDERTAKAVIALRLQAVLWRDLLVTNRDPKTLIGASKPLQAATIVPLLKRLWPQLLVGGLGIAVLTLAAVLLSSKNSGTAGSAAAVLGFFGVTGSTVSARLKTSTTNFVAEVARGINADLVVDAITRLPTTSDETGAPALPGASLRQTTVDDLKVESATTAPPSRGSQRVDHVIVLALENRSFDHLLGFLAHPDPSFDGLLTGGPYTNPSWGRGQQVAATPDAKPVLPLDPDHSHDAVMEQLSAGNGPNWHPTSQGFVTSYERKGRNLAAASYGGILGPVIGWISRLVHRPGSKVKGRGPLAMACQAPESVPIMSTLACEFATCTRWFASVPGETWPNRNFLHAATSDGETNIQPRFYTNPTIFELLERGGGTWHIYHDDTPQVWAFVNLWNTPQRHANWYDVAQFAEHVAGNQLPTYSFIEPNHRPPLHTLDHEPVFGEPDVSNSQHPGNNLVSNQAYDRFAADQPTDFSRAEQLVATVYEALRANPAVFRRSILLITYDEHGGLYDHVAPPTGVPNPTKPPNLLTRIVRAFFHPTAKDFDFTMLGPRVPAIVVSPYIPAGTVSLDTRDHASVPATLRALFAPQAQPLSTRDAWATPFHTLLSLPRPRFEGMPDLSQWLGSGPSKADRRDTPRPQAPTIESQGDAKVPQHYEDLVVLAKKVGRSLKQRGVPEAKMPIFTSKMKRARQVTVAFVSEAKRARQANPQTPYPTLEDDEEVPARIDEQIGE